MQLIAHLCETPDPDDPLSTYHSADFLLHGVVPQDIGRALGALEPLTFAGALISDMALQQQAFRHMEIASLDAKTAQAVDAVTVTAAGSSGDYTLGRALGNALRAEAWDARGANVVVLGATAAATAMAQELISCGAASITLLAQNRPAAEGALPNVASSTRMKARALGEPLASIPLEQADILVRSDPALTVEPRFFGPHLSVIDLSPVPLSDMRKAALDVGAKSLGLRDIRAHQTTLALSQILGRRLEHEVFLKLFHASNS